MASAPRTAAERRDAAGVECARLSARQAYLTEAIERRQRTPGAPEAKEAALSRLYRARQLCNRDLARCEELVQSVQSGRDFAPLYRADLPVPRRWPRPAVVNRAAQRQTEFEVFTDLSRRVKRRADQTVDELMARQLEDVDPDYREQPASKRKRGTPGLAPFEYTGRSDLAQPVRKKRMIRPWKDSDEPGDVDM